MKKILAATLCVLALSATGAAAKQEHHRRHEMAPETQYAPNSYYNSNFGIPGNPYAGGGPSGSAEATNSPNASNEIGDD